MLTLRNSEIRGACKVKLIIIFLETHGSAKDSKKNLWDTNYRSMFKNELKKQLKTLKKRIPQPKGEITYISKLL